MTKEEIEKEAQEYTEQFLPHVNTTGHWLGYIAGRTKGEERIAELHEAIDTALVLIVNINNEEIKMAYYRLDEIRHKKEST